MMAWLERLGCALFGHDWEYVQESPSNIFRLCIHCGRVEQEFHPGWGDSSWVFYRYLGKGE